MKNYFDSILLVIILLWGFNHDVCLASNNYGLQTLQEITHRTELQPDLKKDLNIENLQIFLDSAQALAADETRKSIFYARQVLNSAEFQNLSNLKIEALLQLG